MRKLLLALFSVTLLAACGKQLVPAQYTFVEKRIDSTYAPDAHMLAVIQPYKDSLAREMNEVLVISDEVLTKKQPESNLGNMMCDLVLQQARKLSAKPIDFTVLNHGGIRIPSLPKGEIMLGKIYELMPFDNRLVTIELSGATVDSLFNHMAWHVAGARYVIQSDSATQIDIGGIPLDKSKRYTLVVSDYIAGGGDNCTMLKGKLTTDLNILFRDALIVGMKEMKVRSEHLKSVIDGRVRTTN